MSNKPQLIVALDIDSFARMRALVDELADSVDIFKVGSQIFTACGPAAVRFIEARGKKVFLDLKYHDIPNTVASAVSSAVKLGLAVERSVRMIKGEPTKPQGLFMYTLHTLGGLSMMKTAVEAGIKAAKEAGLPKPLAVGVTVLTSQKSVGVESGLSQGLTSQLKSDNILELVLERAALAKKAGLDGVVASAHEAKYIRERFGKDFIIVTPGIRPQGEAAGDQKRVTTPKAAVQSGSNYLVVGRPVVQAPNPKQAVKKILEEIKVK